MNRSVWFLLGWALLFSWFLASCTGARADADGASEARQVDRVTEAAPEPAHGSYGSNLGDASLLPSGGMRPGLPFPETAIVGSASVDLVYGEGETRVLFRAYGGADAAPNSPPEAGAARFDFAGTREARRGSSIYRIEGRSLLMIQDTQSEGQAESAPLHRWDAPHELVAGPLVFQDRILVATSAPSFVAIDRATFSPVFERPMASLAVGPLVLVAEPRVLVAFHADGTVGHYSLRIEPPRADVTPPTIDPVAALLDPPSAAIAAMEGKTATLMGRPETRLPPVRLYGPRKTVSGSEPALFRVDVEGPGSAMRLYLDGASDAPYLVAAFDSAGAFLKSNIDYTGAEKVLELRFQEGATYYFAVAFLASSDVAAGESARPEPVARFVIAPKK